MKENEACTVKTIGTMKTVQVSIIFDEGCLEYFLPFEKMSIPRCCNDFIRESETPVECRFSFSQLMMGSWRLVINHLLSGCTLDFLIPAAEVKWLECEAVCQAQCVSFTLATMSR